MTDTDDVLGRLRNVIERFIEVMDETMRDYQRTVELREHIMRVNAGNRRRQSRIRR